MFYTDLVDDTKPNENEIKLKQHESEVKIDSLDELEIADHAVISFDEKTYCHCIIGKIDVENNRIEIFYYDDGNFECGIDEHLKNEKCIKSAGCKKAELFYDKKKFEIFKVKYSEEVKCLTPKETIDKANDLLGKTKYNVFENNDEHFASYCKTGKAGKLFLIDPQDVNPNEIFGGNIAQKLTANLAQQGTNVILVNTATHIATKFPRSIAAAALPAVAEAAGSVIGIGIEGITMGYDIHKKYKDKKDGKLSTLKFKKYIARRVTRGTFGVAGGIGGGIVGQMVIPVPVVGALVGGFVGGLVGAAVGYGQGILLGELVEKIDTKVKEKKEKEEEKPIKYHVLDKLVFKFQKNITEAKPENDGPVINNEDYDIYVINNLNDNLVEEATTDANAIELPLDLDVYISLNPSHKK